MGMFLDKGNTSEYLRLERKFFNDWMEITKGYFLLIDKRVVLKLIFFL